MGQSYPQGGHVRVMSSGGALMYDYPTNQEVDSSPAIGAFLPGGADGIVIGTGSHFPGASDTDTLKALTVRLGLVWSDTLDGLTGSSPALGDFSGDGQLDVAEGADTGTSGSVWVLNGATGAPYGTRPSPAGSSARSSPPTCPGAVTRISWCRPPTASRCWTAAAARK